MLIHSLICITSSNKSNVFLILVLLYKLCLFSSCSFLRFLPPILSNYVPWCSFLHASCTWGSWTFCTCSEFSSNLKFSIITSKFFLSSGLLKLSHSLLSFCLYVIFTRGWSRRGFFFPFHFGSFLLLCFQVH